MYMDNFGNFGNFLAFWTYLVVARMLADFMCLFQDFGVLSLFGKFRFQIYIVIYELQICCVFTTILCFSYSYNTAGEYTTRAS